MPACPLDFTVSLYIYFWDGGIPVTSSDNNSIVNTY